MLATKTKGSALARSGARMRGPYVAVSQMQPSNVPARMAHGVAQPREAHGARECPHRVVLVELWRQGQAIAP